MSVETKAVDNTITTLRWGNAPVTKLVSVAIMVLFLVVFLYDPDGSAVGADLLGVAPGVLVVIATLVGDLAWLMGVVMWAVFGWTLVLVLDDAVRETTKQLLLQAAQKSGLDPLKPFSPPKWMTVLGYVSLSIAVLGIASGFWFTATGWAALSIILIVYRKKMLTELLTALTGHDYQGEKIIHAYTMK